LGLLYFEGLIILRFNDFTLFLFTLVAIKKSIFRLVDQQGKKEKPLKPWHRALSMRKMREILVWRLGTGNAFLT